MSSFYTSSSNHHRLLQLSAVCDATRPKKVQLSTSRHCEDFHLKGLCRSSLLPWQPSVSTTLCKSCQSQRPEVTAWLISPSSSDIKFFIWILLRCFGSTLGGREISKVRLTGIGQITNRIFTGSASKIKSSQPRESLGYKPHRVSTESADSTSPGWRPPTDASPQVRELIKQLCCRFAAEPWCVCVCVWVWGVKKSELNMKENVIKEQDRTDILGKTDRSLFHTRSERTARTSGWNHFVRAEASSQFLFFSL